MNFAIIGATGNVGRKTIEILEKSNIQISNLFLVASEKSEGKKIKFKGKEIQIESLKVARNLRPEYNMVMLEKPARISLIVLLLCTHSSIT